jgi:hypothetical protein
MINSRRPRERHKGRERRSPCARTGGRTSSWTCQFLWPAGCSVRRTVLNPVLRGVVEPPGNRRASPHLRWGTELQVNCRPFGVPRGPLLSGQPNSTILPGEQRLVTPPGAPSRPVLVSPVTACRVPTVRIVSDVRTLRLRPTARRRPAQSKRNGPTHGRLRFFAPTFEVHLD